MAVLGINVAGAVAYCAILEGGSIIESEPFKLEATPGMSVSAGLNALANDVELLVSERAITRIVIVGPENSYKGTYVALVPRIGVETAILIAGARTAVPTERLSRPDVRSKLGLPMAGKLKDLSREVLPEAGKLWTDKRDIAALGALSGGQLS
ncbi:hypothetical protein BayCH28_25115 [Mycolicibacterium sp. CH28]|uniref:hypothetical protein n=1 Tax=Mycolicibacterium sp. CH28 TaxID=2512237 RepID=UPI00108090CF|nr:hypothetical protein [Mycolicibacterium sp. CH28]TGD84674.1 hypothetical protein BayCH28_25115 [Mycolicibacterium sp. CH28]